MDDQSGPIIAVVVLFRPDEDALNALGSLTVADLGPVVVVNDADAALVARLNAIGAAAVIANDSNVGLARAFNQGIERALALGAGHVMLLDQDSRPDPAMARDLLARAAAFTADGGKLGAIGPTPVDKKRPAAHAAVDGAPIGHGMLSVPTIISSGMVIPREAIETVGGMWNELFIDAIDHEWCFRARAAGFVILRAVDCTMPHDMGDSGISVLGRYKPIHRSALRHFHIVRNTLWLARLSFIPRVWRVRETLKLALRAPAYLLAGSARRESAAAVWRGLRQGLAGAPSRSFTAQARESGRPIGSPPASSPSSSPPFTR